MTRSVDQTHRVVEEGRPSSRNAMSQMDDMLYSQLTEVFEGNVGEVTNMLQSLPTFDAHDPSFHRFVEGWPRLFERIKETYAEHRALRASLESVTEQLSEIAGVEPGSVSDQTSESLCKQLLQLADDLELSRRRAESASVAKTEFLANMSHEIRTPMNGVIGMTELLASTKLSERQRTYVERVQQSAVLLIGIINQILDFSRVESGLLQFESIDFDLRRTTEEAAEVVVATAHQKRLD
ncbi:MAG: histidine kinase dimerization/phospho-acceptor domain-containing protein, partial [Myxococcota bacterium]